jgi:hydrogenase maturation protease
MERLLDHFEGLQGRVCLLCIGNPDGGDDALGVRLGEELAREELPDVVIAGADPERFVLSGRGDGYDHVIFVDAVDFGAAPGSVVFLNATEMTARFPQVSTHRLSLGLLAQWLQTRGATQAWLLGVQPRSLERRHELSPDVQTTVTVLGEFLKGRFTAGAGVC